MFFLRKFIDCLVSYTDSRTICEYSAGFFFQLLQLVVQAVVLLIAHDFPVFLVICLRGLIQLFYQFFHSL